MHGAHEVLVPNPVTGMLAEVIELDDDAVATSGIDKRIWWATASRPAHHLLDPATGRARLDRRAERHRQGAHRRARRGAGQGGDPRRAAARAARSSPATAAC